MMGEIKNIAKKMLLILSEVRAVEKKGYNSHQQYKFAQEVDVVHAVKQSMATHNVACFPEILETKVIDRKLSADVKDTSKRFITQVKMQYRWVDCDSGEHICTTWFGYGLTKPIRASIQLLQAVTSTQF